ncbi:MAG: DUF4445 domain-containing protein [Caldilineaceae bacterium]|nr:DUF4445 domain-containing protein [Caldilineaceae bacterium]MBP8123050.1 DUF4445 domain-containing protein [Caldilineaceae bacterium]MBP9073411.1 DUF4445 domain-containing protein [Caldilineaceae bacterium]
MGQGDRWVNKQLTEFTVDFEPIGRRGRTQADGTLLDAAQSAGVDLISLCGGVGACDSCKVRLVTGDLTASTLIEADLFSTAELADGWRLACQAQPLSHVKVDVPPESLTTPQRLQIEGDMVSIALAPAVRAVGLIITPPHLHDLRDDLTRLQDAWRSHEGTQADLVIPMPVLQTLSIRLRQHNWHVRLVVNNHDELIALLAPDTALCGLAVDIGTTSIAAYLVSLEAGAILAKTGAMNPQIAYGEDVVSRIMYCNEHEKGRALMQSRLVETLNRLIADLCATANITADQIVDVVVVGNTVMHHLFAGLPVQQLGEAPYVPAVAKALQISAHEIGLNVAIDAQVYLPPNLAGYVGADHVAMLQASGILNQPETSIALDIGTNTEITLTHRGRHYSCACASGPAFEGAHITDGMRAAPGAIERIQWHEGEIRTQSIGGHKAVGICGSGILDAVAVMVAGGIVDARGMLQRTHPLVHLSAAGKPVFVLVPAATSGNGRDILVSRQDVAEIQLAKAAIRAGIDLLLAEAGISANDLGQFIIAGAFGTYIHVASAIKIGMFPEIPENRFRQIGNAAGMGAIHLLISHPSRQQMEIYSREIQYLELTTHHEFQNAFVSQMGFGSA